MVIGIPKEIKNQEYRVAMTPMGVQSLVKLGHRVLVETNAGAGSGYSDDSYRAVGAELVPEARQVWDTADMILKVKEPLPAEYRFFREGLILFAYLHLAAAGDLANELMRKKVTAIAYETIQLDDGSLPLLAPMSEVAGRMAVQIGAHYLEKAQGGRGVLLGGVPGMEPGEVVIIGGGIVGMNAAKIAVGLRAKVTILENNPQRLRELENLFDGRVQTITSNEFNIRKAVTNADLLIGAVLLPGEKAPCLVTEEMVRRMRPGSVIVDVAVDQGGCIETVDRVTTHAEPTYSKHDVLHYAVANMPGSVPYTSTLALTDVTLPYVILLASAGLDRAVSANRALSKGINVRDGKVTNEAVARLFRNAAV